MLTAASGTLNVPTWLGVAGGFFGVLSLLGGSYAILRSSVQTKTSQLWKEQAEAFEARLTEQEHEAEQCRRNNMKLEERYASQQKEIDTLRSVVSARPELMALRRDISTAHEETLAFLRRIATVVAAPVPPRKEGGRGKESNG